MWCIVLVIVCNAHELSCSVGSLSLDMIADFRIKEALVLSLSLCVCVHACVFV